MAIAFIRTIILYLLLTVGIRIMGKKQVGELETVELVFTMLISDLAAVPMQDFGIPLAYGLIPIITLIGMQIGSLLGGAVIVEQIFSLPGLGQMTLTGINQRDYPVVQGCVLFIAFIYVLVNLVTDLLYAYIDPRISYD